MIAHLFLANPRFADFVREVEERVYLVVCEVIASWNCNIYFHFDMGHIHLCEKMVLTINGF